MTLSKSIITGLVLLVLAGGCIRDKKPAPKLSDYDTMPAHMSNGRIIVDENNDEQADIVFTKDGLMYYAKNHETHFVKTSESIEMPESMRRAFTDELLSERKAQYEIDKLKHQYETMEIY